MGEQIVAKKNGRKQRALLALFFALCFLLSACAHTSASAGQWRVHVYVGNALYANIPLDEQSTMEIVQEDGAKNILCIDENGVYIQSANCHNQDCVHQSALSEESIQTRVLGEFLICLPNKVTVELVREPGA